MVEMRKLKNGLRVALEEIPYVRSISFGIWVKNGSRNETAEENGASHFIEHMMFKGTTNRTAKDIAEEMDALGGQINAYTTKEYTCYHTRVLDKHFTAALDVLSDMFLHSKFDAKDMAKEKNVIGEEIFMYEDAPEELVHDALQEAIWQGSSLGMNILGTVETLQKIDRDALVSYYQRNYQIENTVLSLAGNFKIEEIMKELEVSFGSWENEVPFAPKDTKTKYIPSLVVRKKDVEQVHLCLAFPGLQRDHEKKYAMAVLNTIFGGGMSSRLFQRVREENGLTYSIYSYTSAYEDCGLFAVYASMNPNQVEEAVSLIFEEMKRLKTEEFSEKIVEITKEQIISNFIIGTESTANRMNAAGAVALLRNTLETTEEVIEKIQMVTVEDLMELVSLLFQKEQMSLCAVGNVENISWKALMEQAAF